MKRMIFAALAIAVAAPSVAQTSSGRIEITSISTGWNLEVFSIASSSPVVNPAGCPKSDLYAADSSVLGFKLYYAAALMALQNKQQVVVTVANQGCASNNRPMIIGVQVFPN